MFGNACSNKKLNFKKTKNLKGKNAKKLPTTYTQTKKGLVLEYKSKVFEAKNTDITTKQDLKKQKVLFFVTNYEKTLKKRHELKSANL